MENRLRGPAPRRRQRSAQDSGPKLQFVAWQSSPCLALFILAGLPNITARNFVGLSGAAKPSYRPRDAMSLIAQKPGLAAFSPMFNERYIDPVFRRSSFRVRCP